jgi:spore coat protein U-like protein
VERKVGLSTVARSTIGALAASVVLAFLLTTVSFVGANTDNANLSVSAAVNVRCSVAVGTLNFGSTYVSGQAAPLDSASVVVVSCDPGRKVAIKMGQGLHPAPGSTDNNPRRRMQNGANFLDYNLYEDAGRTQVWDNRSNSVKTTRVFPYTATIYGRIPGSQLAYPGTYTDTVIATVFY